ncbi:MAG: protein translocase subunit SecD [Polyangia bacterium]
MERKWLGKVIFALLLVLLAVGASVTTVVPEPAGDDQRDPLEGIREMFPGVNLGLDLQGGLRLIYEVQVTAAVEDKRDTVAEGIIDSLEEKHEITEVEMVRPRDSSAKFDLVFASEGDRTAEETHETLKDFRRSAVIDMEEGSTIHMSLVDELVEETEQLAVKQAIETIGNRIDELGLVNTSVVPRGIDIIVEIPGINERQVSRIKRIIGQTARLEFKIVDEEASEEFFTSEAVAEKIREEKEQDGPVELRRVPRPVAGKTVYEYYLEAKNEVKGRSGRQILKEFLSDLEVPDDHSIAFQEKQVLDEAGNPTADVTWRTYYLRRRAGITGEYVENAAILSDQQTNEPYVSLDFSQVGGEIFAKLTEENVGRNMAIVLDDKVNSAPNIEEKIPGGRARITLGGYKSYDEKFKESRDLVVVLRAGALPAPVEPVTETTIGPQLGQDAIEMGTLALSIAGLAIVIFMIIYYRAGGVAADIALIANALFIVGILSGAGATLTLPGIAGIILTIGMAVDANVIIYERVREELRGGKSPRAAVEAGYKRAFWTIFDAQITTFIAGVVMLQYGTGAIKGFAVTLLIGIVTSMFSAIFVSRLVFDFMTRRRAETLNI